jgi:glycogenin glucosyltransferase
MAYITVCTNKEYILGVLILKKSLEQTGSAYPLACLVPTTMSEKYKDILKNNDISVLEHDNSIQLPKDLVKANTEAGRSNYNESFFKLFIFDMIEFSKLVFIDADMMVVNNIDHLFEFDHMTSCDAGRLYPGNEDWVTLNSGLMVIVPDNKITYELLQLLNGKNNFVGDQDVINALYSDWPKNNKLHLSEKYNLNYGWLDYYVNTLGYSLNGDEPIKVIHYTGRVKPWMKKPPFFRVRRPANRAVSHTAFAF